MNINIRLRCIEVPLLRDSYMVEAHEGSTIGTVLRELHSNYDLGPLTLEKLLYAVHLLNNTGASIDTALKNGDSITVIRTLEGG